MACIQKSKKNTQCSKLAVLDEMYPGYCRYHINRFKEGKDQPDPVIIAELNIAEEHILNNVNPLPPIPELPIEPENNNIPQNIPRINIMPFGFDFNGGVFRNPEVNDDIDNRLDDYIAKNLPEIRNRLQGNLTVQQKDDILIEIVMRSEDEERGFLIANYERLFDFIHDVLNTIPVQNIQPDIPPGLVNMILAALGFNNNAGQAGAIVHPEPGAGIPAVRIANNLGDFNQDTQNVHTKEVVNPVLETAKKMMTLSKKKSPEQDTFKDVIVECKLSDAARKQLCFMYYSEDKIYNLKGPTYRLVLDGIWSYILKQKEDIKKDILVRMSQELEDNIGMCPQGNLSRIINILSGFMEGAGIAYKESLQDKMAKLSKIEEKEKRLQKAKDVLKKDKVPEDQWSAWLEALQ
jgi:hypothetical protein